MSVERYIKQIVGDVMEMAAKIKFLEAKVAAAESWNAEYTADAQAQLEAVRRERDEVNLYLTQERANKDSLAACVDRDVQKIKDLQAVLAVVRAKAKSDKEIYFAHIADLQSQLAQRSDERDRLRKALQSYAECGDGCTCGDGWSHDIANAALTPAAGGTRHG